MTLTFPQREAANPEVRIGRLAEAWMRESGFETFREVTVAGRRIDLVGRCGNVIWVMECKMSASMALMAQAWHWRGRANLVTLVAPLPARGTRDMVSGWCRQSGLGWLKAEATEEAGSIDEFVRTPYRRIADFQKNRWRELLRDEHKSYSEAGSKVGGWTPFKHSVGLIEDAVLRSPGISLADLVRQLHGSLHYKSDDMALRAIPVWIQKGVIKNVVLSKEGKRWRLTHRSQVLL